MSVCGKISTCNTTKVTFTCYQVFTKGEDTILNFKVKSDVSNVDLSNYDRVRVALYQYHTIYKVYETNYDSEISITQVTNNNNEIELDVNIEITESISSMFLSIPLKMDVYLENTNNGNTIYISDIAVANVEQSKYNSLSGALIYDERDGFQDLIADFSVNFKNINHGETIQFNNLTNKNVSFLIWDFGDGNTSTSQNPSHTYLNSGIYTVKLLVSDLISSDFKVKKDLIEVNDVGIGTMKVGSTLVVK